MSRQTIVLLVGVTVAGAPACRSLMGTHGPSKSERAKVSQLVGPFDQRGVPLRQALEAVKAAASQPLSMDVCSSLEDAPVTIVTTRPEELGFVVRGLAMQVGARVRLFIGNHGEVARPTLYCGEVGGRLTTLRARGASMP